MRLEHNIALQQKQSLIISTQAIQSLAVLQFGQEELQAYVSELAERNPFIEITGTSPARGPSGTPAGPAGPGATAVARDLSKPIAARGAPSGAVPARRGFRSGDDDLGSLERTLAARVSLREVLRAQLALAFRDRVDEIVAVEIVESTDSDGYMRRNIGEIADTLGTSEERVAEVLSTVQSFEPAGVCARNLAECLRLQLQDRGRLTPAMDLLLDNLHLLAEFDFARLSRICRVSREDVIAMAGEIRSLDPRPGRKFDADPVLPALPDILVQRSDDGGITVELNSDFLPKVLVDRRYYADIKARSRDERDHTFVVDCMRNASWLVRNLDQRARTVLQVATEIAARQQQFLERGVEHLSPLRLKDVAEAIGIHESTVCRAIANKFMMTPHGMFELKYFFTSAIASADGGGDLSAQTIRHKIRHMIEQETAQNVLADDAIVAALHDAGIDIARRTIAKYREIMHIPSSRRRRRQKAAAELCAAA